MNRSDADPAPPSALAPLRHPVFRMLWTAWLIANTPCVDERRRGGRLMTSLTRAPVMVALV